MNIKSVIAPKSPYPIEVEEGKSYHWCQCGQNISNYNILTIKNNKNEQLI